MSNKTLNNGAILFFVVLMAGLAFNAFTSKSYKASNQYVINQFGNNDYFLSYDQLHQALTSQEPGTFLFVDLREESAFAENQVPGAINIPFSKLLERKSLKKIAKAKKQTPVLYAGEEATAQKARFLLLSKGFEEILLVGGNFETIRQHAIETFDPAFAFFRDEKARFDYMRFMQGGVADAPARRSAAAVPQAQTQTVSTQGGC